VAAQLGFSSGPVYYRLARTKAEIEQLNLGRQALTNGTRPATAPARRRRRPAANRRRQPPAEPSWG